MDVASSSGTDARAAVIELTTSAAKGANVSAATVGTISTSEYWTTLTLILKPHSIRANITKYIINWFTICIRMSGQIDQYRQRVFKSYANTDWFLPSRDELDAMYDNLKTYGVGEFVNDSYWSSSEYNANGANSINFTDGTMSLNMGKLSPIRVRACRSFIGNVGEYALRSTGPGGGLIFYILDDTKYYEAAAMDQDESESWSNVSGAIGTTGTAIGDGFDNTDEIIGQVGFTDGAAKVCKDLIL